MSATALAVSVLIASHNRRELLCRCLDKLAQQSQDPETFEVVVADDGSSDGTAEMLRKLETPFRLHALVLGKVGKAAALNAALSEVRGEVCLFLDDDVIPSPALVAEHVAAHRDEPMTLGLGRLLQRPPSRRDPYARAAAERWNKRYDELGDKEPDWADCYGANFSAPLATLRLVGGFAADLPAVEDLEIAFRLCRSGCVPRYLPQAKAVHDDEKPGSRILAHEQRFGAWCVSHVKANPETRRRLIGWFDETTTREIALRRLLLALRVPPSALAGIGHLVPGRRRLGVWLGFVARYAFWHGVRSEISRDDWFQTTGGVPVLMYHAFTDSGEKDRFILSKRSFARQMRLLAALRYHVIGFEDLARTLQDGRPLPRRSVAITIDDGYEDNFEIAYPILKRHGFTATLFLVSDRLGGSSDWAGSGATKGRAMLSTEQVGQMQSHGLEAGAHTRTHPSLPELPDESVAAEVQESRTALESKLDGGVRTFAYPYGEFDGRAVAAARRAAFLGACTTVARHARLGDDPMLIPRIEVRGSDRIRHFLRKLWIGGE